MLYRQPVRTSRAAQLSRRLGALAVPLLVLTLAGHRVDLVDTPQTIVLVGLVSVISLGSFLSAAIGLAVVWERGFRGASDALRGIVYALIALSPVFYGSYAAATNPPVIDVSTDWADPPQFEAAAKLRVGRMNPLALPGPDQIQLEKRAFPDLTTRRFGIGSDQLYGAAKKVVERNGWKIVRETVPKDESGSGQIEAVAHTLLLGAEDDVVVRIVGEPTGARVDVRSASRFGTHDLGQNASRIRGFFASLNAAVTESFGQ